MTRANTWLNKDGLKVPFGTSDGVQSNAGSIHTKGSLKELRVVLDHSNLPVAGSAVEGDNVGIPAGAAILGATLTTTETFSGAVTFGLMDADGVTVDADGLITTGTPAAGSVTVGAGALINTTVPALNTYYAHVAGTVTAGAGELVITYSI